MVQSEKKRFLLREKRILVLTILLLSTTLSLSVPRSWQQASDYKSIAIDYVSSQNGIPKENLIVVQGNFTRFPLTSVVLWSGKVVDTSTHNTYGIYIDQSGKVVPDVSAIRKAEQAKYLEVYGRISSNALTALATAASSQLIDAAIWINASLTYPSRELPRDQQLAYVQDQVSSLTRPAVDYLTQNGYTIEYVSKFAPLIFATIRADTMTALARDSSLISQLNIGFVDTNQKNGNYSMDSMKRSVLQNVVIDTYGYDGSRGNIANTNNPVEVAVVETDGVANSNPYLPSVTYYDPGSPDVGEHATHVAGVIAETGPNSANGAVGQDFRGMAPGAHILSANPVDWSDDHLVAACDWAVNNHADIINHSYWDGSWTFNAFTAYIDHLEWLGVLNVAAAANTSNVYPYCPSYPTQCYYVGNPGLAGNALTAGSFGDVRTPEWPDDSYSGFSLWDDSQSGLTPHGDYNKPDVLAIGERVYAASSFSSAGGLPLSGEYAGTSFSSPQTAGLAATLVHHGLSGWPEAQKAVIMASADHDLGVSRDKEGAGGIVGQHAHDILANSWLTYGGYSRDSGWGQYPNVDLITRQITLMRGEHFRAALVWDRSTSGSYPSISDSLTLDLDLNLFAPGGSYVAGSTTWDNSAEYFDYHASVGGTYTLVAHVYRWDTGTPSDYIALVWWHGLSLADLLGFTAIPTYNQLIVAGDIAINPHGSKPSGVFYQQGRDSTPVGFINGMIGRDPSYGTQNLVNTIFDTYSGLIDQSTGRPYNGYSVIFSVGGPDVNAVTHYYETTSTAADRAPITETFPGSNIVFTDRDGNPILTVPQSSTAVPPGTSDVFVIQILRDSSPRLVVLMDGTTYTGTWAAAVYFKYYLYPTISTWHSAYYIVRWNDAGNLAPDCGDTFTILAQGNPP
jgi:hypothetical protein